MADDKLYALNPDGSLKWTVDHGLFSRSSPIIGSDGIIYWNPGGWLYARNPDGTEKWRIGAPGDSGGLNPSPAIGSDGTLYVPHPTGGLNQYLSAYFTPAYTLTVTKTGTGSGTVTSSPAGINCGADCNEVYNKGTAVTLTATPDAGSSFAGWSGDTSNGQVTMNSDKTCTATFNLTPTPSPTATSTPTPTPTPTPAAGTGAITGTVASLVLGAPITGATVSTDTGGFTATTGANGTYTIINVTPGTYTLTASATGFVSASQSVTVTAGATTTAALFDLSPVAATPTPTPMGTGIVFGIVIDEEYKLEGVTVTITGNNSSDSTETDENGYYEFSGLGAGEYAITYEKEGYLSQTQDISLNEGEVKDIGTVTMEQVVSGKIYGNVVDIKGNPLEFVRLRLKGVKTKVIKTASSDADGFFEFTDLGADIYVIFAKKKGYKKTQQKVVLEEGGSEEIEIVMKKTSKRIKELLMKEDIQ